MTIYVVIPDKEAHIDWTGTYRPTTNGNNTMTITTTEVAIVEATFTLDEMSVATARQEVASAITSTYGATRKYAEVLFHQVNQMFWAYEAGDKDLSEAKETFIEKKAFYESLKAAGHSNPSVIWSRIRKLGEEIYNEMYSNMRGEGEGEGAEGEGEGGAASNTKRAPLTRNFDEITKLVAFNLKLDPTTTDADTMYKIEQVTVLLQSALEVLIPN